MLKNVVEEHLTEVKGEDEQCDYSEIKNLVYKDCDHEMWKFYSCDRFIKGWQNRVVRYNSMSKLLSANKWLATWSESSQRGSNRDKLLYAADCDTYFIVVPVSRKATGYNSLSKHIIFEYKCRLQPVNLFGGRIVSDDEDADEVEIEFVPAWIDYTEEKYGRVLFLSFPYYDEDAFTTGEDEDKYPFAKTISHSSLEAGEIDNKTEYYNRIYVGWYNGSTDSFSRQPNNSDTPRYSFLYWYAHVFNGFRFKAFAGRS